MALIFLRLLCVLCIFKSNEASFNLYKSSHPLKKVTRLFERLKHHEVVSFSHNQFHQIDIGAKPLYPMNGLLTFSAFGKEYNLRVRKNVELFSDSFHTEIHRYNHSTKQTDIIVHNTEIPQCYYTAEVLSDDSTSGRTGVFSACRGQGIRGWIHAFNETIVIRPKLLLTDTSYKGKHRISDPHIVYKYQDLDRSDYPHHDGPTCGHDHPRTEQMLDEEIQRWKDKDPSRIEWIYHQRNYLKQHLDHDHDHDHEHEHEHEDIIANPFSPHAKEVGANILKNLGVRGDEDGARRLQTGSTTRYVELAIVNDPGMLSEYNNDYSFLQEKSISIVSTLQSYYLSTDWGSTVGTVQIVLSAIFYVDSFGTLQQPVLSTCSGSAPSLYDSTPPSVYCEVEYSSYLSNFQNYRASLLKDYDNAQLFSYYDFASSVIGYASLPGMCLSSSSGGIEQTTYDDEYNGNIVAHEMGHNFDMKHDGSAGGNSCDQSAYIMASVGSPYGTRPNSFSSCSVGYCSSFFSNPSYQNSLKCLDNRPSETSFAVCGNGFVEEGESCDCGQSDCGSLDPCCDGSTCALYASSECSNDDDCCEDCKFKTAGTICREQDDSNTCDIQEERCTGSSSECPPDFRYVEGTQCDDGASSFGYCYGGSCVSLEQQCQVYGARSGVGYSLAETSCTGFTPKWQVDSSRCGNDIRCERSGDGACVRLSSEEPDDGIPCNQTSSTEPAQCVSGSCQTSSSIYTYVWTVEAWDTCNVSCKTTESDEPGYQTRVVECTLQNGTVVDDETLCSKPDTNGDATNPKPSRGRVCNDYVCDFCAAQPNGDTVCGEHGYCEPLLAICDCDSGYAGQFCDQPPGLNFTGITSMAFKDVTTGDTLSYRANPCFEDSNLSIATVYDIASATRTIPLNVSSLTELYVGSTVGVRWTSAGDIELLAVGMVSVDENGDIPDDDWPFYVGSGLAQDDSTCDDVNSTSYDGCLRKLECNDFSFRVPVDITPGDYRLIVRFNNEFRIESPVLTVLCNENNCNSEGHGSCNADDSGCDCDDGWSGPSCSYSSCQDWSFAVCDKDENGNCGSLGSTDYKPKCFSSSCDSSVLNSTLDADNEFINQCDTPLTNAAASGDKGCDDQHFEGQFCEIPRDRCGELVSQNACTDVDIAGGLCSWDATANTCIYSQCAQFLTQEDCEASGNSTSNVFVSNNTWSMFCEWVTDDNSNSYCNRITCGGGLLPQCENGAVRRPIFDVHSEEPVSICRAWFCDCSTIEDVSNSYWTVSSTSTLLAGISSSYYYLSPPDGSPLTADYIASDEYLSLFTCSACGLECFNEATVDDACTNCFDGCPTEMDPFRSGVACNQVFWIGSLRLAVNWEVAFIGKHDEFESLIIADLAYFLSTDIKHISIWQVKPDGDGSIVYFRYLFDTDNDENTQILGGDVMALARKEIADSTSSAARGFIMQYTDSSYEFKHCVPSMEECDPSKQIDILFIFYICSGGSFGALALAVIIYRLATRSRRQRAYEAKVREVRQAQLRLMEHHSKARRVGMRDVSKQRANKIHKAQRDREKEQKKEIKRRAEHEKKLNKINENENGDDAYEMAASYHSLQDGGGQGGGGLAVAAAAPGSFAPGSHSQHDSGLELEQYRRYSAQAPPAYAASVPGGLGAGSGNAARSRAATHQVGMAGNKNKNNNLSQQQNPRGYAQSVHSRSRGYSEDPAANLPPNWKVYYNNDGIPYYYNNSTGQTTWRHPKQ